MAYQTLLTAGLIHVVYLDEITDIFSKELSRSFHRAFDERQASDYGEMLEPDQESAMVLFEQAQIFVN